jgi:cysteine-rich repeat protein
MLDPRRRSCVADLMSHRWLIAVSMGAHLAVAGGLFVAGAWNIERLDGHHRFLEGIGVMPPPPAPSGGPVAVKAPEIKRKEKKHPPPVTVQLPPTTAPVTPETGDETPGPGRGPGPGTPDDTGKCLENCGASAPVDPVCGNGSLEAGEQCDDGNTASGDGCSSTCRIEVKPKPTPVLAPSVMQGLRLSGETQVHPSSATQTMMVHDGASRVVGAVKLCISTDGGVTSTAMLVSTKYSDYDATLLSAVRGWRYRPYTLNGAPVPACSSVTFIYTIR